MKLHLSPCFRMFPGLAVFIAGLFLILGCATTKQRGAIGRAYAAYDAGLFGKALACLSRAEAYQEVPANRRAEVVFMKAKCLEGMGHRAEAASLYEFLLKNYPDSDFSARAKARLVELSEAPPATVEPMPAPTMLPVDR